jgi:phosphoglycerate dehydrogenase-like enzyme
MRILTLAPFDAKYLELIEQKVGTVVKGPQEEDYLIPGSQLIQLLKEELPTIMIIEINRIPTEVLLEATSLRVIAVCRSGVDNVNVEAATERGIL